MAFICGRNFHSERPGRRAVALIHEMLHTLGLRETPPSLAEISAEVDFRLRDVTAGTCPHRFPAWFNDAQLGIFTEVGTLDPDRLAELHTEASKTLRDPI